MRVRVRYAKSGKLRFISAIDLGRVWERALRKAKLPIAYSEGFSPHPKVSFADALPLGYASTGEYAELTFAGSIALRPAVEALNAAFPDGLGVRAAVEVGPDAPRLSRLLAASLWDLQFPSSVEVAQLAAAVERTVSASILPVERERKGEKTTIDLRPMLGSLGHTEDTVRAVLIHPEHLPPPATGVSVRPSVVWQALAGDTPLPPPALITRVAQGRPVAEGLVEALEGAAHHVYPGEREFRPPASSGDAPVVNSSDGRTAGTM